jgi:hypothetical protein
VRLDRPPLWSTDTGLLPIEKNAAPCRYLDTDKLWPDMPRLPDKIHPTMTARKEWAKRVVDRLARERKPNGAMPWEPLVSSNPSSAVSPATSLGLQ